MIAYQGKEYITLNDKIYFPGDGSGGKIIKAYYRNNLVYPRTSTIDDIIIDGGGTVTPPLLLRFSNTWNTINSGSGGGDQDSHVILIDNSGNVNIYIYHSHKSVKNGKLDVDNTSGTPSGNASKGGRYPVENVVFKSDYDPNYPVLIDGYYWLIVRAYGTTTGYYYSTISYQDDSVKLNYQLNRSTVPSKNTYVVAVLKVVNHEVSKVYDQADLIRFFNENSSMFRTVRSTIPGTSTFVNSTTNYFTRI